MFKIDAETLKPRAKKAADSDLAAVDRVAADAGFPSREPRQRGRPRSPRTGQIHAKVLPDVAAEIAAEAATRGITQGVLIEEAWDALLRARAGRKKSFK